MCCTVDDALYLIVKMKIIAIFFLLSAVQAALGPVALDLARSQKSDDETYSLANSVLVISVLAIISTAPLGKCDSLLCVQAGLG